MQRHKYATSITHLYAILIIFFLVAADTYAADATWTGAADTAWNNAGNWVITPSGTIPVDGDSLIFNSAAPANQPSNNDIPDLTVSGIEFLFGAGSHTLGGNDINLGWKLTGPITHSGDIINDSSATQTINNTITLDASRHLITTGTSTLNLSGLNTQSKGSTAIFTDGGGGINLAGSTLNNLNDILGGWATIGSDWAVRHPTTNSVVPLGTAGVGAYSEVLPGGTIADNSASNVRINFPTDNTAITMVANGATRINSLLLRASSGTQTVDIGVDPNALVDNTLVLGQNGGIYNATREDSPVSLTIGGTGGEGVLTAGDGISPANITLSSNGNPSAAGVMTINANIEDNGSAPVSVTLMGGYFTPSTAATNTFSGGLYIVSGRWSQPQANTMGTGPVHIFPGGMINPGAGGIDILIPNDMFIAGHGTPESAGLGAVRMFQNADGFSTQLTGTVTLVDTASVNSNGLTAAQIAAGRHIGITGKITGPGGLMITSPTFNAGNNNGTGIVEIGPNTGAAAGPNDYAGDTTINGGQGGGSLGGALWIRNPDAGNIMPHGATGSFSGGATGNVILNATSSNRNATFDLNGSEQTINGLSSTIASPENNFVQNSNASFASHLILGDNNADGDYGGAVRDNGGTLAITKTGSGTQTFSGADLSYSGATTVIGGRLNLNSDLPNSAVTISNGTALGATGIDIGSTLTFGAASTDTSTLYVVTAEAPDSSINLTGTDTLVVNSGANTITVNIDPGSMVEATTYRVLDYNGSIMGSGAGAGAFVLGSLPNRTTATLVHNAAQTALDLNVTAADRPRWSGKESTEWSTDAIPGDGNWVLDSDGTTKTDFLTNDHPLFDDTATGTTVDISKADVQPASVTFNNSTKTYTLTGSKGIAGPAKMFKNGTGSLIVANSNSHTGGTDINAGSVQIGDGGTSGDLGIGPIANATLLIIDRSDSHTVPNNISGAGEVRHAGSGSVTLSGNNSYTGVTSIQTGTVVATRSESLGDLAAGGAVNVSAGATLDIGGSEGANSIDFGNKQFNIVGTGVDGLGAIINSNTAVPQQNAFENVVLTGDATIGAYGRIDVRGGVASLDLGGSTLTKKGEDQFTIVGGTVTDGNIVVEEGTLAFETSTQVVDFASGKKITFQDGTRLQFFNTEANSGFVNRPMEFNGTVEVRNADDSGSRLDSNVTMNGSATYTFVNDSSPASPLTETGVISEAGGPRGIEVKTVNAANSLVLQGVNTYTGSTSISGPGTLDIAPFDTQGHFDDDSIVSVGSESFLNLSFFNTDTVRALVLDGVSVAPGEWGPVGSLAPNQSDRLTDTLLFGGTITVLEQILPGDFNDDDKIDAADYVVWRKNQGTFNILSNDPLFGTEIDGDQYDIWRANFGTTIPGGGAGAGLPGAVPEPGAIVFALVAMFGAVFLRSRGVYWAPLLRC